jgi:glycerophosphoryl diester phosphodiesterase
MTESLTEVPLPQVYFSVPFAHRGFHDCGGDFGFGRTENSTAAFRCAINAGYGIELDLQLSSDGVPVVFHDKSLKRLTQINKKVRDLNISSLKKLRLTNNETILTFNEFLKLVAGKVPVLVELKDQDGFLGSNIGILESAVAFALKRYNGPIAVMSYNSYSIKKFGLMLPSIPRGLVTEAFAMADWPELGIETLNNLRSLKAVKEVAASFISHEYMDLDSRFLKKLSPDVKVFSWTIRSKSALEVALKRSHNITFEGFVP